MPAFGAEGIGFKFRTDQICHMLPTTRHRCNIDVWVLVLSRGDEHRSLMTSERVLSKYDEDSNFLFDTPLCFHAFFYYF